MFTRNLNLAFLSHYDYSIPTRLANLKVKWSCDVFQVNTCGSNHHELFVYKFNRQANISFTNNEGITERLNLYDFNAKFPESGLNLSYNCHGWTFANGKFLIMDHDIPKILEDEFIEVSATDNHDIVVFKRLEDNECIHSCRKEANGYSHKDWIKSHYNISSIYEILAMPQYADSKPHYYKKTKVNCGKLCLNTIDGIQRSLVA